MAKLYFYYSSMNSGKSTILLQTAFNYEERNMKVLILLSNILDTEFVCSRTGLQRKARIYNYTDCLYDIVKSYNDLSCVLVDEAQFLNKVQVIELAKVCDTLNIPVLCYGLRSDFLGEPFEGSMYLLTIADKLIEIKTMCYCGKKATMNMRKVNNESDVITPIFEGTQIKIGGNESYISLCRKCYVQLKSDALLMASILY